MKAPVQRVRVHPVHPGPNNKPSYIEITVGIGEQRTNNVGVLTVEQALALAEDALNAARIVMARA